MHTSDKTPSLYTVLPCSDDHQGRCNSNPRSTSQSVRSYDWKDRAGKMRADVSRVWHFDLMEAQNENIILGNSTYNIEAPEHRTQALSRFVGASAGRR